MKLEKYKKSRKLKKSLIITLIITIIAVGSIILYKTYAIYQEKHEYNVIKGVIPNFGYDVKFAIKVDDKEAASIPDRQAANKNYYSVEADCGENTQAEWDYNAWNLKVDNIKSNSKCNLTFTSNLTESEYKEYIESGIEYRRNTYRGKDITSLKTSGDLYKQISNCTFDDIYVGDYILSTQKDADNKPIKWLIADLNNYRYSGDTALTKCHATIIPANRLATGRMNPTNSTAAANTVTSGMPGYNKAAYFGSEMVNAAEKFDCTYNDNHYTCNTLTSVLNDYVLKDFEDSHVLTYRNLLSNAMDSNRSNQYGRSNGASSNWEWVSRKIDLMSEVNVYGSTVWSSSGYDIGIDNRQYAIFQLRPDLINTDGNGFRYWYWLKAVATSTDFALVAGNGYAGTNNASFAGGGIRPRFLID